MRSPDIPPVEGEALHQGIDAGPGRFVGVAGEVGIPRRGQDRVVAENLLDFQQINAVLDQVRGIAVTQAVRGDLFLCLRRPRRRRYPSD